MIELIEETPAAGETREPVFRIATVGSSFLNGHAQLIFDGQTTATQKYYKRLSSYSPASGDRVLVVKDSGTYIILGKIV